MYQVEHIRCSGCKGNGVRMGAGMMEHTCLECNGKKYIAKEKEVPKPVVVVEAVVEAAEEVVVLETIPEEIDSVEVEAIEENQEAEKEKELIKHTKEQAMKRLKKRS